MSLMTEYEGAFDDDVLDYTQNDLGVELSSYDKHLFRRMAFVSGDEKHRPGRLVMRDYQVNCLWPIMSSVLRNKGETYAQQWPRQSGKSAGVGQLGAQLAGNIPTLMARMYPQFEDGIHIGIYGPRKDKAEAVRDNIESILRKPWYHDSLGIKFDVANGQVIKLNNGSTILCGSASDQAKCVESPSLDLIITEETQALSKQRIVKSLRPMMSHTRGTMVHIGTASHEPREHGFFYEIMRTFDEMKKRGYINPYVFKLSLTDVFNTPGTQRYRQFVKGEIREWKPNSKYIRSQYFGDWEFDIGATFIRPSWLHKLRNGKLKGINHRFWQNVVAGIDVAKVRDCTVVTILEEARQIPNTDPTLVDADEVMIPVVWTMPQVRGWLELHGDKYPDQVKSTKKFLSHYPNLTGGLIDARGPGEPFFDYLTEDQDDGFGAFTEFDRDLSTDIEIMSDFTLLKQTIFNQSWWYPKDNTDEVNEFEKQMELMEKKKRANGQVVIDHPATGRSDYVRSLILALKQAGELDGFRDSMSAINKGYALKREDSKRSKRRRRI